MTTYKIPKYFFLTLIFVFFISTSAIAQLPFPYENPALFQEQEPSQISDYPKLLGLNPNYIFDKKELEKWAENNGWDNAFSIVWENHNIEIKKNYSESINGTLITPVLSWVRENYKGKRQTYEFTQIERNYLKNSYPLPLKTNFVIRIITTEKENIDLKNLQFELIDSNNNKWLLEKENTKIINKLSRKFAGTHLHDLILDISFDFLDSGDLPDYSQGLTLNVIKKTNKQSTQLKWNFNKTNMQGNNKKEIIMDFISKYNELNINQVQKLSNKLENTKFQSAIEVLIKYINEGNNNSQIFEDIFTPNFVKFSATKRKYILIKLLDIFDVKQIENLYQLLISI